MPNTVRLHRVMATKPEKIYRAFIEADALAKWLPPKREALQSESCSRQADRTDRRYPPDTWHSSSPRSVVERQRGERA